MTDSPARKRRRKLPPVIPASTEAPARRVAATPAVDRRPVANDHPEVMLISSVLSSRDLKLLAIKGVTSDMFHGYPDEWQWLQEQTLRTGVPSRNAFLSVWPNFPVQEEDDAGYWAERVISDHAHDFLTENISSVIDILDGGDIKQAIAALSATVTQASVSMTGSVSGEFDAFADWRETYAGVEARVNRARKDGMAGIPTGFDTLDLATGGLQPGWFTIVAARLGQGKTWTLVKMGLSAAQQGHRVLYFSLEQPRAQIAQRVHTLYAKGAINALDLVRGQGVNMREYRSQLEEAEQSIKGNFQINDGSRGRVGTAHVAAGIEQYQPDVVIIDYITCMKTTGKEWMAIAELSNELQGLAQRYSIPIVSASQINRAGIGKDLPGAEHLSQADQIGQDADMLITMMQKSKSCMAMKLAKFRHGPDGISWFTKFQPGAGFFHEVSGNDAEVLIERDNEV